MAADTAPRRRALGEALFITVALGHVLGSSICNVPGILGVTALIHRIKIPAEIARFAIWALDAATTALLLFLRTRWMLSRWEGGILLTGYAAYLDYLVLHA